MPHPSLQATHAHLSSIHDAIAVYQPFIPIHPILDSSLDDHQWLHHETIPGLKSLMDAVRRDLDVLEKFLADPRCASLPPLSTNAPYLIAVWDQVLCAPPPVTAIFKSFPSPDTPGAPGVKVDVVADNGRRWIRVNTIKTDRILAELREIDGYSDASDSTAEPEPDTSLLRLARSLLCAAAAHPIPGTSHTPHITIRLTRIDPHDPRIARTLQRLTDMGIDVHPGPGPSEQQQQQHHPPVPRTPLAPSPRVNLDLSALIALISDHTHAQLPHPPELAHARFPAQHGPSADKGTHMRALADQALRETRRGLLQELSDQLAHVPSVEFWTTPDARDRCLHIVATVGGPGERRRAHALFGCAGEEYWRGSRYPRGFLAFLPVRVHASAEPGAHGGARVSPFCGALADTCRAILARETVPQPQGEDEGGGRVPRVSVVRANARLTVHTVQSMLWGAELGWTTLTANKASVKAILREMAAHGRAEGDIVAAIWVVEPRSLAEGMRADDELQVAR